MSIAIEFGLNGRIRTETVAPNSVLVDHLHDHCDLNGARIGCSRGVCGACTVLVDGVPVASCSMFTFQVDGKSVTTIEGLGTDGKIDEVQQAFIDSAAFQCGYCTAGMILLTKALLAHNPRPDRATIIDWLSSNVCRCTGYAQIIAAVEVASDRMATNAAEART